METERKKILTEGSEFANIDELSQVRSGVKKLKRQKRKKILTRQKTCDTIKKLAKAGGGAGGLMNIEKFIV